MIRRGECVTTATYRAINLVASYARFCWLAALFYGYFGVMLCFFKPWGGYYRSQATSQRLQCGVGYFVP